MWIHNRTSSLVASVGASRHHPHLRGGVQHSRRCGHVPAGGSGPRRAGHLPGGHGAGERARGPALGLYHGLAVRAPDGAITLRLAVEGPGRVVVTPHERLPRTARRLRPDRASGSAVISAGQRCVVVRRRPGRRLPATGSAGLRPALCLATCTAFGGDVEDALPRRPPSSSSTASSSTTTSRTTASCGEARRRSTAATVERSP